MTKSRRDGADWKQGPDALFRAVRADHEPTTDDYARVEAELARRLTAGAASKQTPQGAAPPTAAKLTQPLTPGPLLKLGVALLLLAAGSFGVARVARMLDREHTAASRVGSRTEDFLPSAPAAPVAQSEPPPAAAPAAVSAARTPARQESTARVAPSRVARSASAPRHASADRGAAASLQASPPREAASVATPVGATSSPVAPSAATPAQLPTASVAREALPSRAARKQPQPATTTPPAPTQARAPEPQPTAAKSSAPIAAKPTAQTRPTPDSADGRAELALVERMQAAMRAANPTDALELCAEHARRWPRGVFAEEREAVAAIASCTLRSTDAVARAQLFLRTHPRAPTAARVAAACAPLSAATKPDATH